MTTMTISKQNTDRPPPCETQLKNLSYISSFHLFTSGYNAFSANTAPNKRLSALFSRSGKLAGIAVKMRKYSRP
jgi:hypothetical protein